MKPMMAWRKRSAMCYILLHCSLAVSHYTTQHPAQTPRSDSYYRIDFTDGIMTWRWMDGWRYRAADYVSCGIFIFICVLWRAIHVYVSVDVICLMCLLFILSPLSSLLYITNKQLWNRL
jgi:hypothetical protein